MNKKPTLMDALELIQDATEMLSINNENQCNCVSCTSLDVALVKLKKQLNKDTGMPLEFFAPADPKGTVEISPSDDLQPGNPDLTPEAIELCHDVYCIMSYESFVLQLPNTLILVLW
ncbi:MAG: hypothetical protein WCL18_05085 [bacterium]